MTKRLDLDAAIMMLGGDRTFLLEAMARGLAEADKLDRITVERVRIARTLVRDLEVNWQGVEVVMNLRDELLATRRQVRELVDALRRQDE